MFTFRVDDEIQLKLLEQPDAFPLFVLIDRQRDYLREFLPWVDRVTSAENYFASIAGWTEQFRQGLGFQAGILYRGELCGMIGFHPYDLQNRRTSIGYWLSGDRQGKGIMTRCCRAVIDDAFETTAVNRIEIGAATQNAKSRAIPERLGFAHEGTIRDAEWIYDHFVNHEIYSLLRSEWRKARLKKANP
ncbi:MULTISPECIES: GNAT family N-acetyltransferase [unclassified Sporolactobacillus]|uniref:GNAT family N-acetyltransferase n=1 Tax=unclassified Sporolactobacillus TaxID=2628533 RepID=UPI002367E69D|nr:GNAT family protein [Sporolactobacillus sp. CQH2019]MDD9148291.1 GNAT family protein [Sporolactobacillus sp. CQH2019]